MIYSALTAIGCDELSTLSANDAVRQLVYLQLKGKDPEQMVAILMPIFKRMERACAYLKANDALHVLEDEGCLASKIA